MTTAIATNCILQIISFSNLGILRIIIGTMSTAWEEFWLKFYKLCKNRTQMDIGEKQEIRARNCLYISQNRDNLKTTVLIIRFVLRKNVQMFLGWLELTISWYNWNTWFYVFNKIIIVFCEILSVCYRKNFAIFFSRFNNNLIFLVYLDASKCLTSFLFRISELKHSCRMQSAAQYVGMRQRMSWKHFRERRSNTDFQSTSNRNISLS